MQARKAAKIGRRRHDEEGAQEAPAGETSVRAASSLGNATVQRLARSGHVPAALLQRVIHREGEDSESVASGLPEGRVPLPMKVGHVNWGIAVMQALLNQVTQDDVPMLEIDRIFGPRTETAVRLVQWTHEIEIDGIAGDDTFDALDEAGADVDAAVETAREAGMLF
jgi:peptidoglycan hydrolase-like protein with peptidoglycan-binding domain